MGAGQYPGNTGSFKEGFLQGSFKGSFFKTTTRARASGFRVSFKGFLFRGSIEGPSNRSSKGSVRAPLQYTLPPLVINGSARDAKLPHVVEPNNNYSTGTAATAETDGQTDINSFMHAGMHTSMPAGMHACVRRYEGT